MTMLDNPAAGHFLPLEPGHSSPGRIEKSGGDTAGEDGAGGSARPMCFARTVLPLTTP